MTKMKYDRPNKHHEQVYRVPKMDSRESWWKLIERNREAYKKLVRDQEAQLADIKRLLA
jgi:hypothetical protein